MSITHTNQTHHPESDKTGRAKRIYRVTIVGAIVNLLLVLIKFVVGLFGRSSALVADAVHSLSDFCTDIVVLLFVSIASKPRDADHRYGHGKYESMATIVIAIVLIAVGVGMFWSSSKNIYDFFTGRSTLSKPSVWAAVIAMISILSKESLFRYTKWVALEVKSDTVLANAWHHRTDAYSSIAALVGICGAIFLSDRWVVLDPIACAVVSLFVIWAGIGLVRPPLRELTEHSLPEDDLQQILSIIDATAPEVHPHNLNTRSLGYGVAIEVDICLPDDTLLHKAHLIATRIEEALKEHYGETTHVVVHIEPHSVMHTDHA